MPPRLPTKADLPSSLVLDIVPPQKGSPVNILLLLHGLGDTQTAFTRLAQNLNLPETAAISLRGFTPIPAIFTGDETPSFHWAHDVVFDETRGELDLDGEFAPSLKTFRELLDALMEKCGYAPRNIFFYGFGQGAMLPLAVGALLPETEFGGVVAIGGRLPGSGTGTGKGKTPILICGGSKSRQVTKGAVAVLRERFADVEYVRWEKPEDAMPANRDEMLPIMRFFARRLRSRAGVPDGAVEV
jgi:predicted esterase